MILSMASIRKHPNSQYWYACYTLPDGRQKQTATGTEDKYEAMQIALTLDKASKIAKRGQMTEEKAKDLVSEICLIAGKPDPFDEYPLKNFYEKFLVSLKRRVSESAHEKYTRFTNEFLRFLGQKQEKGVSTLKKVDCTQWRDHLLKEGYAVKTVNSRLSFVGRAFREGLEQGSLEKNPFEGVQIKKSSIRSAKRKPFTFEQFSKLVAKTSGEWQLAILFGGYTGQRLHDILGLEESQLDFEKEVIWFMRLKNRDWLPFEVPMHPSLEKVLKDWSCKKGKVFPELGSLPKTGKDNPSHKFRMEILPKIGITQPYHKREGKGRVTPPYQFHSLRHSLSTWLNEAGVSDIDRQRLVGHEDEAVSRQYTHTELSNARRAIEKLPGL